MSDFFTYRSGILFAEGVSVQALAQRHGTPLYVYSRNRLREQCRELSRAMAEVSPLICYSVKANSNGAVIRTFLDEGAGLDIVSGGELFRSLRAGADPSKIVFAGVGKTAKEIEFALEKNILFFTVESEPELERVSECARRLGKTARVALRVNPDVDSGTHEYVTTGKKENKFGMDIERASRAYERAARLPNVEVTGLHLHIGSQVLTPEPFVQAIGKVKKLCAGLKGAHKSFRYIDIGGGIGIKYRPEEQDLDFGRFAEAVVPLLMETRLDVVMEPGRCLVGAAGILVCRVEYVKENASKKFVIADAGMNDLVRPTLYDAYHEVMPVTQTEETFFGDLVGPVCESGDFQALGRRLPAVREGDLLAVRNAGAYGFAMSSTYNSRPRPAEVMVDGDKDFTVRDRETPEDLVRGEKI